MTGSAEAPGPSVFWGLLFARVVRRCRRSSWPNGARPIQPDLKGDSRFGIFCIELDQTPPVRSRLVGETRTVKPERVNMRFVSACLGLTTLLGVASCAIDSPPPPPE